MKPDQKRSSRLNQLLKVYLNNPDENLYMRAKLLGVTDNTAKDYVRTVIIQANKMGKSITN